MSKPTTNHPIVFPTTIIVDKREQKPFDFADIHADSNEGNALIKIETLQALITTGDYSLRGHEVSGIVVERKSKADLYQTISRHRNRFKRELARMQQFQFSYVVVEAEISELLSEPPAFTKYPPKALHRSIISWELEYPRTHWRFCPGRRFAEVLTFRILSKYLEKYNENQSIITKDGTKNGPL